jgi:hypothetical protein
MGYFREEGAEMSVVYSNKRGLLFAVLLRECDRLYPAAAESNVPIALVRA